MYDPRVFRGSTYSAHTKAKFENLRAKRDQKKRVERRKPIDNSHLYSRIAEKRSVDVQTEKFLEELTDKVPETETQTQTEAFLEQQTNPVFVEQKRGVDAETQVLDNELFDFDREVEPILEVLVGKTLQHAFVEVMEEVELSEIECHKRKFEEERNRERSKVEKMEAEAKRRNEERERRMEQQKARKEKEDEIKQMVAARSFATEYMTELNKSVFEQLLENGELYDPVVREIEDQFLPWLASEIKTKANGRERARLLLHFMLKRALDSTRALAKQKTS